MARINYAGVTQYKFKMNRFEAGNEAGDSRLQLH